MTPFRALVSAHLHGSWNRLRRSLGTRGVWAFAILLTFIGISFLPAFAALATLGFAAGASLQESTAQAWLPFASVGLTAFFFIGGALGGLAGGSRQLPWETLQVFPVTARSLFASELFACAGEALTLMELLALATFCVGATIGCPSGALYFFVLFVTHAGALLALQLLAGSLSQALVKRFRIVMLALPFLGLSMSWLGSALAQSQPSKLFAVKSPEIDLLTRWLPARQLFNATREGSGSVAVIFSLAVTALLVGISYVVVSRENNEEGEESSGPPVSLWSFSLPVWGVARLQWESLIQSLPGRFGLLMPLVTIVLLRGPFAEAMAGKSWATLAAFAYASLGSTNLLFNQFGLDRNGVKGLLLLPIDYGDLLKGKLLGFTAWQALQLLMLVVLLALIGHRDTAQLRNGVLLGLCIFGVQTIVGQFCSIWQPRPLKKNGLRAAQPPLPVVLLILGMTVVMTLVGVGGTYWVSQIFPGWEPAYLGGLALTLAALQLPAVRFHSRLLEHEREKLVEVLGSAA